MVKGANETELVRGIASGNISAFNQLYERYRDRVFGFALRMLGEREIAEDVAHEAFLTLIEHPERYQAARGSVLTFLCAVARNQVLLYWRRCGHRIEEQTEDETFGSNVADLPDPLSNVLGQERAQAVLSAVAVLPPLQREVIVLREFDELSYAEIAIVTETSVDVVKMRLRRARQSLMLRLSAYMNTEEQNYELHRSKPRSRSCA
jgi:RNA polymerase sigma-70 factor (ECF subfamily)